MRLVDQASEFALGHRQSLLRVDLLDQRKLAAGSVDNVKRLLPALIEIAHLPCSGDADLLRQRLENIQQLRPGTVTSPPCCIIHHARRYELHFEIGAGDVEPIIPR